MNNNDVILYENNVVVDNLGDVKLTVTEKNIIFEKKKGLFKKQLKIVDKIAIDKIKLYKDKAYIKQKKNIVTINTIDKEVVITFNNLIEAKKVYGMLNNLRVGTNAIDRGTKKINKVVKNIGKIAGTLAGVVVVGIEIFNRANGKK